MKKSIIFVAILAVIGFGIYFYSKKSDNKVSVSTVDNTATSTNTQVGLTGTTTASEQKKEVTVIGQSVEGRPIYAYHFGDGNRKVLFIGGIHGGYSWNTSLVAYKAIDYYKSNPDRLQKNISLTIIPVLNPDGLLKVVGTTTGAFTSANVSPSEAIQTAGRFNSNNVDLNRNFDCDWQQNGKWQTKVVSGGSKAFSEPESITVKNFVDTQKPAAALVWYSAAGGVFASSCHNGVLPETLILTNVFAKASGYPAYENFNFYEITGDMVNWFAKKEIPAISVLLASHSDIEWSKNLAGIEALLNQVSSK